MNEFGHIIWLHEVCNDLIDDQIEYCLSEQEDDADSLKDKHTWIKSRQTNDHAYFCLLVFQLEQAIKSAFMRLCNSRGSKAIGADRIAWERVKTSKADFLTMVKFLLPDEIHLYHRAKELYRDRNKIAHEGELSLPIQMSTAQRDIIDISTRIHSALSDLEAAP
ncbi:MAG: hypothetical protein WCF85_12675 [Rhodospirillaceae bacterium]